MDKPKYDKFNVYNIYCAEKEVKDGKNLVKIKKMGIALVPDKNCSILCKNIFNNKIGSKALIKCQYNSEKNGWIPFEEEKTQKMPSFLTDIEKELEIVACSDSEGDNSS